MLGDKALELRFGSMSGNGCDGRSRYGAGGGLRCAIALGRQLDTPTFLWGLTVVAAATSIPDMLISVCASAERRSESSISNVLGSNILDRLVAVPLGVLIPGTMR